MRQFQVMVLGAGGVGKSAITMRFVRDVFVDSYNPTIEENYLRRVELEGTTSMLDVLDTAGAEQFSSMNDVYYRSGHGFVLVFSLANEASIREVEAIKEQLKQAKPLAPIVIVANKLDLVNERQVSAEAVKELSKRWQIPVYETSAKRNWQVAAVFEDLVKQMRNCYPTEQLKQRKRKRDKLCLIM